jgi:hypothetical protein
MALNTPIKSRLRSLFTTHPMIWREARIASSAGGSLFIGVTVNAFSARSRDLIDTGQSRSKRGGEGLMSVRFALCIAAALGVSKAFATATGDFWIDLGVLKGTEPAVAATREVCDAKAPSLSKDLAHADELATIERIPSPKK